MQKLLVCLAATLLWVTPVAADDLAEIKDVVQKYFDGTEQGRPELVAEAFLPSLELQYVGSDSGLRRITGPDYISRIKPGKPYPRKGHIVNIDVTGNAATVKAEVDMSKRLFTDYLLLLKVDGAWRISNKIATSRTK